MAFETTPTLGIFDTGYENPYSDGGKWGQEADRPRLQGGTGAVAGTQEFVVNGMTYYAQVFYGAIVEAFGCTPDPDLGAALESNRVALWTNPDAPTGYSSGHGGGIGQSYFLRRYNGGGTSDYTGIGDIPNTTNTHPTKLGIRITPTRVEQYGMIGGVWTLITYAADTTYRGPFYLALETEEQGGINEVSFRCFGAAAVNRQHIYRWLKTGTN